MLNEKFLPDFPEQLLVDNNDYQALLFQLWQWWQNSDNFAASHCKNAQKPSGIKQAIVVSREPGVVAGRQEIEAVVREFYELDCDFKFEDGQTFEAGDLVLELKGDFAEILELERLLLNFLGRMMGIATKVHGLSAELDHIRLAATRKTLWSVLDKKAVSVGGGLTHRLSKAQALMIKDNDWPWFESELFSANGADLTEMIGSFAFVEVEVETEAELKRFLDFAHRYLEIAGLPPLGILIDNKDPDQLKDYLKELPAGLFVEASGNITEENYQEYDLVGLDYVSMGSLTKHSQMLDLSLKLAS